MATTEAFTQPVEVLRAPAARSWSPAQLIAPALGFVFTAWGLISIGHSGFHPERVFQPHDALVGLHYTPFLASLEVGFGLAMLIGGALLRAARTQVKTLNGLAVGLGTVIVALAAGAALGLGIVILIDAWPTQVHHWLNADHRDGVLYLVAGVIGLCAAVVSPLVLTPADARSPLQRERSSPPEPEPTPETSAAKPELVGAPEAS